MADTIQLFDRAEIKGAKRDGAGNLVVRDARIARAGVYEYAGYELGQPEKRVIRVLRPESEVFARDTMRSLAAIPVTDGHPKELIDTGNWKDHAKGETSDDDIVRDGESVRVPFIVRDEASIKNVEDGKHELSPGYTAVIDWTAGTDDKFGAYDAVARGIRYNHLAIVDRARGGSSCRIGDEEPGDKTVSTKIILVDGYSVETTEAGERAILKLVDERKALSDKLTESETKLTDANKAKATLEGEKAALETQLKDATNPENLNKAAAARSELCQKAKAIVSSIVTDGKTDAAIRKEVVESKLGDAAKGFSDDQVSGAFATLIATVKVKDALADAITGTGVNAEDVTTLVKDHATARQAMLDNLRNAHKASADKE